MQKNTKQTVARNVCPVRWFSRAAVLRRVLGGILFLTLIYQPVRAYSVVLPGAGSVNLAWDRSPSPEVTGYRIYYGAVSQSYSNSIMVGNVTNTTVPNLTTGNTYYFTAIAFNASGLESIFSNEILYIVPGGTAQMQIQVAPNKQAILTVTGKTNHIYEIQATTDLKTWTVLGSVTLGASGSVNYTNTNAGSFPKRFYRTRDTQP
jgi:hypothetical protein